MTGKKGAPPQFQTNDRIFAKVKGYPAWPACVTGPNDAKGTRYKVCYAFIFDLNRSGLLNVFHA